MKIYFHFSNVQTDQARNDVDLKNTTYYPTILCKYPQKKGYHPEIAGGNPLLSNICSLLSKI
jgi:hypothetical protein